MCSLNGIIPSYLISAYVLSWLFLQRNTLSGSKAGSKAGRFHATRATRFVQRNRWQTTNSNNTYRTAALRCVLTASGSESTVQRFGCAIEGELFVKLLYFAINSEDAFFNGLVPSALLCWAVDTVVGSAFDASGTIRPCLYRCAAGISLIPVKRIGQHHL